jgi:hypothetical protein
MISPIPITYLTRARDDSELNTQVLSGSQKLSTVALSLISGWVTIRAASPEDSSAHFRVVYPGQKTTKIFLTSYLFISKKELFLLIFSYTFNTRLLRTEYV